MSQFFDDEAADYQNYLRYGSATGYNAANKTKFGVPARDYAAREVARHRKVPSYIASRVRKIAQQYNKRRVVIDGIWYAVSDTGWVTRA